MSDEIKKVADEVSSLISAIRSENFEAKDVVSRNKIEKMEGDLAKALQAKSELEARLDAVEAVAAKSNLQTKSFDGKDEYEAKYEAKYKEFMRNPANENLKSQVLEFHKKSINIATPEAGGVAVPTSTASTILSALHASSPIRQLATVITTNTSSVTIPVDDAAWGATWVNSGASYGVTANAALSACRPSFGTLNAVVEIDKTALEDMGFDVSGWVTQGIINKFARTEGLAFLSGTGAAGFQPSGILGNVSERTQTAASFNADVYGSLADFVAQLKAPYRTNAKFLMNSRTAASLIKLVDDNGRPLWLDSMQAGRPASLFGYEVLLDENLEDIGASNTPMLFGDFKSGYVIADRVGVEIVANPYQKSGYVLYEGRKRVGGAVGIAEALIQLDLS